MALAAFSGYALVKRRKRGGEALTMWTTSLIISLGVAWLTRPFGGAAAAAGSSSAAGGSAGVIAYLDAVRAKRNAEDPGWADRVFQRLADQPGVKEKLDTQPLVKAAIV